MTREILKNHIKAVIEGIKHLDTDSAADLIAEIADEIADTSYEDAIDGAILDGIRWGYRAAVVVEMRGGAMLRAILPGGCGITHEWADEIKAKAQIRAALAAARADTSQATIARLTAELAEAREKNGALIEMAAQIADAETGWAGTPYQSSMQYGPGIGARIARTIRALDPYASAALAARDKRVREEETRACIEANRAAREVVIHSGQVAFIDGVREGHNRADRALTARLDQRKEGSA